MSDAPELLPPEGEPKGWHWLKAPDGSVTMGQCLIYSWSINGSLLLLKNAWKRGYRYHTPARPSDATERARLEGENARLREALEAVITHAETTITNWPANYPYDPDDLAEAVDAAKEALRHGR